jgi:hypothetical protein
MALPRPASPKALWADIRAFTSERRPHQWVGLGLAVVMPLSLVVLFLVDGRTNIAPGESITYVESWPATRTDAEIIADQKKHQAIKEKAQAERQRQFKRLDERLEKAGL